MNRVISGFFGAVVLSGLAGCPEEPLVTTGTEMEPYFPFDGRRSWEFIADDTNAFDYIQQARLREDFETVDIDGAPTQAYTIDFFVDCVDDDLPCGGDARTGDPLRSIQISADSLKGVLIHGYAVGAGEMVSLDPPLKVAPARQVIGGSEESETDGTSFSSTFTGYEDCPVQRDVAWPECLRFDIEDGETAHPLGGTFWAVTTYGIIAFDMGGSGLWKLRDVGYCADDDDDCVL
jgi:hypothetical protein